MGVQYCFTRFTETLQMKSFILLLSCILQFSKSEQIPPNQLYTELSRDEVKACAKGLQNFKTESCDLSDPSIRRVAEDYICRYSQKYAMIRGRFIRVNNCHCCGYIYDYVEYGEVCTGYCKLSDEDREYGLSPIIRLPFNWGENCPERITTEDGDEIPCNEDTYAPLRKGYWDSDNNSGDNVDTSDTGTSTTTTSTSTSTSEKPSEVHFPSSAPTSSTVRTPATSTFTIRRTTTFRPSSDRKSSDIKRKTKPLETLLNTKVQALESTTTSRSQSQRKTTFSKRVESSLSTTEKYTTTYIDGPVWSV